MRYFQTPASGKVRREQDFSFLQEDNYLKLWHSEMPELQMASSDILISPYLRSSSCEIELDCSCKDILNIWENDKNIIGGSSIRGDHNI
jgi:hypothetical protein